MVTQGGGRARLSAGLHLHLPLGWDTLVCLCVCGGGGREESIISTCAIVYMYRWACQALHMSGVARGRVCLPLCWPQSLPWSGGGEGEKGRQHRCLPTQVTGTNMQPLASRPTQSYLVAHECLACLDELNGKRVQAPLSPSVKTQLCC